MPRRKVKKKPAQQEHWSRIEELSRRQSQRSIAAGMVVGVASLGAMFVGVLWAAVRAPQVVDPSSWPFPALALFGAGVLGVIGGLTWAMSAVMVKSQWERDIRKFRDD